MSGNSMSIFGIMCFASYQWRQDNALIREAAAKWFGRFRSRNFDFDVKGAPRSGRPSTVVVETLHKVEEDRHISSYALFFLIFLIPIIIILCYV